MLGILKPKYFVVLAFISGLVSALAAQAASQPAVMVRVASQATAPTENKNPRVFISNVGSDADQPGGPNRAYNKFYATVQRSGQYQLASSPAEADFVFEIRYTDPHEDVTEWRDKYGQLSTYPNGPGHQERVVVTIYHPQVRLVILDPRTHAVHGVFTEHLEVVREQRERDARLSSAIQLLVGYAANLLGRSPTSSDVPSLVSVPPTPTQITSAKTVFISNASPAVAAYNLFYAMMATRGGYELSPGTAGADLILQLSADPRLRVAIIDPQTGVTLWGFRPDLEPTIFKRNARKDLDRALAAIVVDVANLSGRAAPASSTPQTVNDAALPPDGPIPPQLGSAKTVFISNVVGEPLRDWKSRPLQPYNAFYATMKSWARLKLVATPAEADLVFQISVVRSEPLFLRLTILDSRTQAALWELNQDIRSDQTIQGSFAEPKDLDKAIAALVTSLAKLAGQPDAHISVPPDTQTAPPPSRISDFRKVFISRPPEENGFFAENAPDQLYATLDAALRTWGHYQMTAPSEADLIFEPSVSDSHLPLGAAVSNGTGLISVQSAWGLRVRLTIRDAKTRHILWTFVRPVRMTVINDDVLSNYRDVVGLLVDDLRQMTALTPQATPKTAASR